MVYRMDIFHINLLIFLILLEKTENKQKEAHIFKKKHVQNEH